MALMERVATLLRANLSDLLDRAEDPVTAVQQLMLDMENQLLQVKTQVAIALADQHLLEKKALEREQAAAGWHRRAELAVSKGDDALARAALRRALMHETMLAAVRAQIVDQRGEAEALRSTYLQLGSKLAETQAEGERLIAQPGRVRMISKAAARAATQRAAPEALRPQGVSRPPAPTLDQGVNADALPQTGRERSGFAPSEHRPEPLEVDHGVEQRLAELKAKSRLLPTG